MFCKNKLFWISCFCKKNIIIIWSCLKLEFWTIMRVKLLICMLNLPIWGNFKIRQMKPLKTPQNLSLVFLKLTNKSLPLHKPFLPLQNPTRKQSLRVLGFSKYATFGWIICFFVYKRRSCQLPSLLSKVQICYVSWWCA